MNPDWSAYLESLGDRLQPDAPCALASLDDIGLIRVTGADARDFLQGQLTADIREVSPEQGQISAYCTPKGRMLSIFLIFQRDDALYLQLPRERLEPVLKRLRMFVLRAQVTLEDASDELVISGLAGNCLDDLLDAPPAGGFATARQGELTLLRLPGDPQRVELVGPADASIAFWKQAGEKAEAVSGDTWALMNIRAGLPTVYEGTAEAFVPQMCNLDLLGGISFTKGCYTGQEVVARMKYLGQLKRRMYVARMESEACPAPGEPLHSPTSKSAQGAGKVVDARPLPEGGCEVLVVAEIRAFEAGDLRLGDADGPPLSLHEPPYGLASEETES